MLLTPSVLNEIFGMLEIVKNSEQINTVGYIKLIWYMIFFRLEPGFLGFRSFFTGI